MESLTPAWYRGFGWRQLAVGALVALLGACGGASVSPTPAAPQPTAALSVDGIPVICGQHIGRAECASRADLILNHSLVPPHPPVVRIVVTCDADLCDEDEGFGQVIVHFNDGTREVIDIGFGVTTD